MYCVIISVTLGMFITPETIQSCVFDEVLRVKKIEKRESFKSNAIMTHCKKKMENDRSKYNCVIQHPWCVNI